MQVETTSTVQTIVILQRFGCILAEGARIFRTTHEDGASAQIGIILLELQLRELNKTAHLLLSLHGTHAVETARAV